VSAHTIFDAGHPLIEGDLIAANGNGNIDLHPVNRAFLQQAKRFVASICDWNAGRVRLQRFATHKEIAKRQYNHLWASLALLKFLEGLRRVAFNED